MKSIDRLIPDIYKMLENKEVAEGVDLEAEAQRFGEECANILRDVLSKDHDTRKLRLSQIGKPNRLIWNQFNGIAGEDLKGATFNKFLYGHLIEAQVVALSRCAGHTVEDQQKTVEINGIKGHIDGRIDGFLVDVKSASGHSFKKFKRNELHKRDDFGYIGQLKAYAHAEGDTKYGWVAMCKQSGELCLLKYDEDDKSAPYADALDWDVEERIEAIKKMAGLAESPSLCYPDQPDGESGNRKLSTGCSYCQYKQSCWPNLRTFGYANGPKYLTYVEKAPRVQEIPHDF